MAELLCEHCNLRVQLPDLKHRERAMCPRCGNQLLAQRDNHTAYALAFALSALIFLSLSVPFDFLLFRASGQQHTMDLFAGLITLSENDYTSLAVITALGTLILPGLSLLGIAYLEYQYQYGEPSFSNYRIHVWVNRLLPWSMAEIFLVGTLVSLIKITSMADIYFGMSFYAYIAFTVCSAFTLLYYERNEVQIWLSDFYAGHEKPLDPQQAVYSIQRTWALLVTAVLFYVPANLLPIMHTNVLGNDEPSTIIGGVVTLWENGSYPVASVIFIASVIVPIVKMIVLAWLNYSVQQQQSNLSGIRAFSYRITELIGRWSMIDVFVVAILVALIQLGNTLSIYPGPAVIAFCAVVFITMLAAMTFDSRLIWYRYTHE
ncbi:paraquat-inducible protein A [Alteromonas facilis]|uniref:paraquat-inducible protein A n=1 Tax=Alteromonas facilis TaxID=2048004 RepID=UPI000C289A78|nr:paraquat-inducible protein A [Alteromonas facilis]